MMRFAQCCNPRVSISVRYNGCEEGSAYSALVATSLAAVKGTLLLDVTAAFSSSLFRLVMVVHFVCKWGVLEVRTRLKIEGA